MGGGWVEEAEELAGAIARGMAGLWAAERSVG